MWPSDDKTPVFAALSYRDKLRVRISLARGEAPESPAMASAAVELAESYERQNRAFISLVRWLPVIMIVCFGYVTISQMLDGYYSLLIPYAFIVMFSGLQLLINPACRPKNMHRSMEAAKRTISASS